MSVFNQSRSTIIRLIIAGIFLLIVAQLVNLQLFSNKYKALALNNAVYPKVKYPDRGIIYDRKGKAILNNTIMYDLEVTPSQIKGVDTNYLCQLLEIDTIEFKKRVVNAIVKNGRYRPSIFEDLLAPLVHARLEENIYKFPGFSLVERPVRTYPFQAAAHIMGYIGEADSAIIKRSENFYRLGDFVGRSGLEQFYEPVLMGKRGVEYMIKDNKNRLVGKYENGQFDTAAIAGRNLRTYIDIEVQQLAEKLMRGKVGAVVAIEPKTGGIIAMTSGPNFDPNLLTGPDKQKNFNKLFLDVSSPLLNRAIKGQYPPGSTYKPLGALVGLDEGVLTSASGIGCAGAYYGCRRPVKCTEKFAGHAANLRLAIAWSCNSFFSNAFRLAIDNPKFKDSREGLTRWHDYLSRFDLGHRTGIDLPSEDGGNVPDTAAYDKEYNRSWNSCTMVTIGIGQDKLLVTPLQMANAVCIVANKGYFYTPHFVDKIDGETKNDTLLNKYRRKNEVLTHIADADFETVISGMQDVVDIGTARVAKIPGINVCAKTGTAENYRMIDGVRTKLKDNSMFVCFAPRENPKIAIAVVVENAGFGATWAGPIAALMMEKYLNDTLRTERLKEVERISNADLLPGYLVREQYKQDSIRAYNWFKMTKDTSVIKRFLRKSVPKPEEVKPLNPVQPKEPVGRVTRLSPEAILPGRQKIVSNSNTYQA
ncbi:penicillin-binding protein 2 [Flavihumibacter profundi]|uniref:penicillin-binding protein 2 n=1 Tax=Flavihumibacter profundi TaxID=2716883 RepID=UPI001CC605E3|nr:penicillin-binding protein 2 [Flavihumibacter profundi]MBZ5858084.1 penicillin-binding protein 2 [Flavihumibacter profundi]